MSTALQPPTTLGRLRECSQTPNEIVGLLEDGAIPHRKVGRHRRILLSDLLAYKRADDEQRRKAADELGGLGQELGI